MTFEASGSLHAVRFLAVAALFGLSSIAFSQTGEGTFRPYAANGIPWKVNANHTLVWGGSPYLPIGARVSEQKEIDAAIAAGVREFVVGLPASGMGWDRAIDSFENAQAHYLVALDSLAEPARGYAVEPQSYRIDGILQDTSIDVPLPGASAALAVLVTRRDGYVQWSKRIEAQDGRLKLKIEAPNSLEHVLLLFPITQSLAMPDYWESFDGARDRLLQTLAQTKFGPGLRGLVNPMGELLRIPSSESRFVPSSLYFRAELKAQLQTRYHNLDTAVKSWSVSASDITTWDQLARLVPLWSGTRGVPRLWDPVTDHLYTSDQKRSTAWSDIDSVIAAAGARRFARLVPAIKKIANVPIVQEWAGWAAPYESSLSPLDGVGMRARGSSLSQLVNAASPAASSILRWTRPGWLPATDIVLPATGAKLSEVVDDLVSMGARGCFFRTSDPAMLTAVAAEAASRAADVSAADYSPIPLFFPENARNPALAQRLPGGRWWLPSPAGGNRIDLGSVFNAYRYRSGDTSFIAMWTSAGEGRVKLRLADNKTVAFESLDGTDLKPKKIKNGVEVFISETPIIITGTEEIPIPEPALTETAAAFEAASKLAENLRRDVTEETFLFKDSASGFDRNPGGAFATMRIQLARMIKKVDRYDWIEAESCRSAAFGEAVSIPGCSGGSALGFDSPFASSVGGYRATFEVPAQSDSDLEVWIAARIPEDVRPFARLVVGGQQMEIPAESVSMYGTGFAWYRVGTTRLAGNKTTIEFRVQGIDATRVALDVLLLYPGQFQPRSIFPPALKPPG